MKRTISMLCILLFSLGSLAACQAEDNPPVDFDFQSVYLPAAETTITLGMTTEAVADLLGDAVSQESFGENQVKYRYDDENGDSVVYYFLEDSLYGVETFSPACGSLDGVTPGMAATDLDDTWTTVLDSKGILTTGMRAFNKDSILVPFHDEKALVQHTLTFHQDGTVASFIVSLL